MSKVELKNVLLRIGQVDIQTKSMEISEDERDDMYTIRNKLVFKALALAKECGFECGVRIDRDIPEGDDPNEPEWVPVWIMIPVLQSDSGDCGECGSVKFEQVSWHVPNFRREWDGHTPEEGRQRCAKMAI